MLLGAAISFVAAVSLSAEEPATPSSPAVASDSAAQDAAPRADPLDFDLLSDPPVAPRATEVAKTEREVKRRRMMLTWHQGFGIGTLASMTTTVLLGALNMHDLYDRGGRRSGHYLWPHRISAYSTTVAFIGTASLSLFAPEPFEIEHQGFDAGVVHRLAVSVASAGMLTQLGLGFVVARRAAAGDASGLYKLARAHQIVGYVTLGALAGAALAWVF